jgi:hypothetical protein
VTTAAVFTLGKDERYHWSQWIAYYSQTFDLADMVIIDHDSHDPTSVRILSDFSAAGGTVLRSDYPLVFDHDWMLAVTHEMQRGLLEQYDYAIYTDSDEIIIPATGTLREFIDRADKDAYACTGYELMDDSDLGLVMYRRVFFDKTSMSRIPLTYGYGWHRAEPHFDPDGELFLYHLHKLDFDEAWAKAQRWSAANWDPKAIAGNHSFQNQITELEPFRQWFFDHEGLPLEPLDERIAAVLPSLR